MIDKNKINIRPETEKDYRAVEGLTREAFWNLYVPGCDEHYLVHILRDHPDFVRELDFVAEVDGKIVGNIMYTKSRVIDETGYKMETISFGPLCVHPDYKRQGIGTALINHTKEIAVNNKEKAIIILGHPHNYCKHGFKNSKDCNIANNEGKYPFGQLVLELEKGVFQGREWKLRLSPVFDLDPKAAGEFDKRFPPKKKEYRYSQEEFSIAVRAYLL